MAGIFFMLPAVVILLGSRCSAAFKCWLPKITHRIKTAVYR
ncbi:MAG: hypothetical protein RLZZ316_1764 [Bacteroidota bacterium]